MYLNEYDPRSFWLHLSSPGFSCYYLSSAKNCEGHSFQSAPQIHEFHVLTSSIACIVLLCDCLASVVIGQSKNRSFIFTALSFGKPTFDIFNSISLDKYYESTLWDCVRGRKVVDHVSVRNR